MRTIKILKWAAITIVALVVVIGVGLVLIVNGMDWNKFRNTIEEQAAKHTGRELTIAGDLSPSFFPWAGISFGQVSLANADGFGGDVFANVDSADVKVELLPLLKREINVKSVELHGMNLNLERNADGATNWDDLTQRESSTTTEDDQGTTTEVEGNSPTIAALAVGGVNISDANVSWVDAMAGTDVKLNDFALTTGAIELDAPFDLSSTFALSSNSMGLQADVSTNAEVSVNLDQQVYSLSGLVLDIDAAGAALPNGALKANLAGDVMAELAEDKLDVAGLVLKTMGIELTSSATVNGLSTEPVIAAMASSNSFNPADVMAALGIEVPVMADASAMSQASMSMNINATAQTLSIDDIILKLDQSTLTGTAAVPSLAGAAPPVRFDLALDVIDADRYLAPTAEAGTDAAGSGDTTATASTEGDTPIELPLEMIRGLDIDGKLSAGEIKVAGLTTTDLIVPITAKNGVVSLTDLSAALYQGKLSATSSLDATGDVGRMRAAFNLAGIQAEPLLEDLSDGDSPLSGTGNVAFDLNTAGASVDALTAALDGTFDTAFTDGAVNGINIGYQLRRAKTLLTGQQMPEQADVKKTDFSSLKVSGTLNDGVMSSDDLDLRSPLLRVGGAGTVAVPQELIDYTATIKITSTAEGQGGEDLQSLNGLALDVPIQATFAALAANPASVIFNGLKDNLTSNLQNQAKAAAQAKLDEEKAKVEARLNAEKAKAQERLDAEKARAQERLDAEKAKVQDRVEEEAKKAANKLKKGLGGLLGQ